MPVDYSQNGKAQNERFLARELDQETSDAIAERLEYLRGEIDAERISYGEIAELQGLADHIDRGDVQLLEWSGVPQA